jgi:hypothetical protein
LRIFEGFWGFFGFFGEYQQNFTKFLDFWNFSIFREYWNFLPATRPQPLWLCFFFAKKYLKQTLFIFQRSIYFIKNFVHAQPFSFSLFRPSYHAP